MLGDDRWKAHHAHHVRARESHRRALQRDLVQPLCAPLTAYRVLDTTLIAVRQQARAGDHGCFAGQAGFGWGAAKGDWGYGFTVGMTAKTAEKQNTPSASGRPASERIREELMHSQRRVINRRQRSLPPAERLTSKRARSSKQPS